MRQSVAVTQRGKPILDGATKTAVFFGVLAIVGLVVSALLAVDDFNTSAGESVVFAATLTCGGLATLFFILSSFVHRARA